jgi:hypothetical protein
MEFIEANLKEVRMKEFAEAAKDAELVINISYSSKSAAISLSPDFVFFELLSPRKFFMGKKKKKDYTKMIKKNAEMIKNEMEKEGSLSVLPKSDL